MSRVKKSIFCFEKSFKIKFLVERTLKIYFQLEIFSMPGFWKQKIDFLTLNKIFVQDNLNIVLDKKYFVLADGRGKNVKQQYWFYCLVHLPGQKNFCHGKNSNCPGQKFCPELKIPFFACKSHSNASSICLDKIFFCPEQCWNCPGQNFCPELKYRFFAFKSNFVINISSWKWIFKALPIKKPYFIWVLKAKNGLFWPGQNFCPGQFWFCPGRWMRHM